MILTKKITQIIFLIFLSLFLASCEEGCVNADQFDSESSVIESNPSTDGVYGTYDPITGGQRADWHNTGLKSNGEKFIIQTSGEWTPWNGGEMSDVKLEALPVCNFCAKKVGMSNCICYSNQTPQPEKGDDGKPRNDVDCSKYLDQNDPAKCTCSKDPQWGNALQYSVYHFPLDVLTKTETYKSADDQVQCKYNRGMGAYIALWGRDGTTTPTRVYHLFSEEEVCNIIRDKDEKCLDSEGRDLTRYVFRSANNRIFMKDDKNGNDDTDTNTVDDVYHEPNEAIKTIMYDRYYTDNYGQYNIEILRGVGNNSDGGLIEYLVASVEDIVLGKINGDDVREGGIIEFMYKGIVQDSGFILLVQVTLSLYITVYGIAFLFGVAEINKKELAGRILKIGLLMFFTSSTSWYWYNQIVVNFFKGGMDYIVAMIMDLSDRNIDQSSMIKISQMDRENNLSNATRFSYVDLTIKKLISVGTAKKIFGLFFTNVFGFLYIPLIYSLIAYFIYVMVTIAIGYLINLLKIVFALSLGPIFMCFTLFKNTEAMFKNWLAFLGARSLEIVILFLVLYNFLMIIDKNFTALLSYGSCLKVYNLGLFSIKVLEADSKRIFIEWMSQIISIGGLLFIMKLIIDKVPTVSGALISIGGVANESGVSQSGFNLASGAMKAAAGLAKQGFSSLSGAAATAGRFGIKGATEYARKSGIAAAWNKAGDAIGIRGPRTRYRDSIIDGAIKNAEAAAGSKKGAERDAFIRAKATEALLGGVKGQSGIYTDPNKMALAGVDPTTIARRLDQKLIEEPLKAALQKKAKELKNLPPEKIPLGKEMRSQLKEAARDWVEKNSSAGFDIHGNSKAEAILAKSSMKDLVKSESQLSSSEAARRFAGNPELQNKYLQHLKDNEAKRLRKTEEARTKGGLLDKAINRTSDVLSRVSDGAFWRDASNSRARTQENFIRKVQNEEGKKSWYNRQVRNNEAIQERAAAATKAVAMSYLKGDVGLEKPGDLKKKLEGKNKEEKQKIRKEHDAAARENKRREFFQNQLRESALKGFPQEMKAIRALEKKGKMAEAHAKKKDLLKRTVDDFGRDSGRTLFEKAARLSYLQQQFGMRGEDALTALSGSMKEERDVRAEEIAKKVAEKKMTPEQAKKELKSLQSSLFDTAARDISKLTRFDSGTVAWAGTFSANSPKKMPPEDEKKKKENADKSNAAINKDREDDIKKAKEREENLAKQERKDKEEREARDKKMQDDLKALAAVGSDESKKKELVDRIKAEQEERDKERKLKEAEEQEARKQELKALNESTTTSLASEARKKELEEQIKKADEKKAAEDAKAAEKTAQEARVKEQEDNVKKLEELKAAPATTESEARQKELQEKALQDQIEAGQKQIDEDKKKKAAEEAEAREKIQKEAEELKAISEAKSALPEDRIKELKQQLDGVDNPHVAASEASKVEVEKSAEAAEKRLKDTQEKLSAVMDNPASTTEEKKAATETADKEVKEIKEIAATTSGIVATEFKVEFGASITDALLKAPNIGLSAGNPLLGVAEDKEGKIDQAALNALSIDKNQISGKLKMAKLDKKVKEFQIQLLEKQGLAGNKDEIARLEKEIEGLDKEITDCQARDEKIEDGLKKARGEV